LVTAEVDRHAVELAERVAERQQSLNGLREAQRYCSKVVLGIDESHAGYTSGCWGGPSAWNFSVYYSPSGEMIACPAFYASTPKPWGDPDRTANDVRALVYFSAGLEAAEAEKHAQADLLRDVIGPVRTEEPARDGLWLTWNGGAVVKLAQAIYNDRAFDNLSILADALEDAGCTNRHMLDHYRQSGEHARGCWVVDLLLEKQ
jgi:hypothetical protein